MTRRLVELFARDGSVPKLRYYSLKRVEQLRGHARLGLLAIPAVIVGCRFKTRSSHLHTAAFEFFNVAWRVLRLDDPELPFTVLTGAHELHPELCSHGLTTAGLPYPRALLVTMAKTVRRSGLAADRLLAPPLLPLVGVRIIFDHTGVLP